MKISWVQGWSVDYTSCPSSEPRWPLRCNSDSQRQAHICDVYQSLDHCQKCWSSLVWIDVWEHHQRVFRWGSKTNIFSWKYDNLTWNQPGRNETTTSLFAYREKSRDQGRLSGCKFFLINLARMFTLQSMISCTYIRRQFYALTLNLGDNWGDNLPKKSLSCKFVL